VLLPEVAEAAVVAKPDQMVEVLVVEAVAEIIPVGQVEVQIPEVVVVAMEMELVMLDRVVVELLF
jgi:hypothetical protein